MKYILRGTFVGLEEEIMSILNNAERGLGAVDIADEMGDRCMTYLIMIALHQLMSIGVVEHRNHFGESEWRLT